MPGQWPLIILKDAPHFADVCDKCENAEVRPPCQWAQCKLFKDKERYQAAVLEGACPAGKMDHFFTETGPAQ